MLHIEETVLLLLETDTSEAVGRTDTVIAVPQITRVPAIGRKVDVLASANRNTGIHAL